MMGGVTGQGQHPHPHPHAYAYVQYPPYHMQALPEGYLSQPHQWQHPNPQQPLHVPPSFHPPQPAAPSLQFRNTFAPNDAASRNPLTSSSFNAQPTPTTSRKRSAPNASANAPAAKRSRRANENTDAGSSSIRAPIPAASGIGPFVNPASGHDVVHDPPAYRVYSSLLRKEKRSTHVASDVWYCVKPASSKIKDDQANQQPSELFYKRPKPTVAPFLACRLCTGRHWHAWLNNDGQTDNIRAHLYAQHWNEYKELVLAKKLKTWEKIAAGWAPPEAGGPRASFANQEHFSVEGFYQRLVKWIVVDDQSLHVVESPELRELLTYISVDLTDSEIPHRTHLTKLIVQNFQTLYENLRHELQNSAGRISFTSDVWSKTDLSAFMAVTAHYMMTKEGKLVLRNQLIAFRHIKGSHTGVHLAEIFLRILKELSILDRIGMITLDNASNNNTMMESLATRLKDEEKIEFDENGNRIRCFPHVTNIATKTGLKHLTKLPENDKEVYDQEADAVLTDELFPALPPYDLDYEYREALEGDVVDAARKLVNACRASGQRREALQDTIAELNAREGLDDSQKLEHLSLLRDVDTRWSSIFYMIDRLMVTYPAIRELLSKEDHESIAHFALSNTQLEVLSHVRAFLNVFHSAQQIVSAQHTPTLAIVIPIYEKLLSMLNDLKSFLPEIAHAIDASIEKLKEYMDKARSTPMYVLAMLVNPEVKLSYVHNWSAEDLTNAKKWVDDALLPHQRAIRESAMPTTVSRRTIVVPSPGARSQASGFSNMESLARQLSSGRLDLGGCSKDRTRHDPTTPTSISAPSPPPASTLSGEDLNASDRAAVKKELDKWLAAGLKPSQPEAFDLVAFWQVEKYNYPILYRLALDVLPVQASAVPCERAFSSSKQTDTDRRSDLDHALMEVLQISKYFHRDERLDFTAGLLATEDECSVLDIPSAVLDELVRTGDIGRLQALIEESRC